eukprot:2670109-Prorocentrum_lima.AAC.1
MAAVRRRSSCRCAAMALACAAVAMCSAAAGAGRMLVGCGAACVGGWRSSVEGRMDGGKTVFAIGVV